MQRYLNQSDLDTYGHEMLDVSRRAAMDVVAPHLQTLSAQNEALLKGLAQERRHRVDAQVAELVPDYKQIDEDPAFHRYLLGVDMLTGRIRQALLDDAIRKGSAERCAAFFRGFQNEAPSGGSTGSVRRPRAAASKPIYTPAQIKAFYEAKRRGAYQGRESEADRIERHVRCAAHQPHCDAALHHEVSEACPWPR
jgi:hypothetical protein